jgi:hypothetical protein
METLTPSTSAAGSASEIECATSSSTSTAIAAEPRAATLRTLWAALLGLAIAIAAMPALWLTPLNHDVACGLYYTRRLMAGAHAYRDFVDNNPPLVFYLFMPIEWLAQHAAMPEARAVAWAFIAMTITVVWLSARLLRADARQAFAIQATLLLSTIAAVLLLPERDFGQREHLTLLLIIPYILLCAVRADGIAGVTRATALMVAAAAAIGFGMKPHFCAALLVLMVYVVIKRRDWRTLLSIENVTIVSLLALYGVTVLLWTPEYVTQMVPIAVAHYGAYTTDLAMLVQDTRVRLLLASLIALSCVPTFLTGSRDAARVIQPLALTGVVFFGIYVIEATSYRYHLLPAMAFYVMAIAVTIVASARTVAALAGQTNRLALALRTLVIAICALPAVVLGAGMYDSHTADLENTRAGVESPLVGPLADPVREVAAGQPIFVLSSSVNPAFPLVNLTGTTWPYRYNSLWLLPAYYRDDQNFAVAAYRPPAAQSAGERAFFDEIIADLRKTPPTILIVDRNRFKQGFGAREFDFVDYYSQSPEFAALFREYDLMAHIPPYDLYRLRASRLPRR